MADRADEVVGRFGGAAPRFVTLDGILEGRTGDAVALQAAVAGLDELGICHFQIERDGGRFSVMPDNDQRPGHHFDQERQEKLLQRLREVAMATHGAIESTLRCTMVFDDECTETLFRAATDPAGGAWIEPLTRVRPVRTEDQPAQLPQRPRLAQLLGRREVTLVLPLLVLAFSLLAWRSGLLDRILAANAAGLAVDSAMFGDLLAIEVQGSLGNYEVCVRRGPGHPSTVAEWDVSTANAATEALRLHQVVVREGQEIYVQLRDSADTVLAQAKLGLRPLVTSADGKASVVLPGRITAARVVLSVERYERH